MKDQSQRKALWAPWRIEYILGPKEPGCIFCRALQREDDAESLILARGEKSFVIMNRFPYNNGHLMVVPYRHTGELAALDESEAADLMRWLQRTTQVLREIMQPAGFNIGLNLGKIAGAGVEDHLHFHIVPRWEGDTNFMPVIADTRVIPEALDKTFAKLRKGFAAKAYR